MHEVREALGVVTALLAARFIVGRALHSDVVIHDDLVSQSHCEVARLKDGRYLVRDLGSMNGTWIIRADGRKTRVYDWTEVYKGDALLIGRRFIPYMVPNDKLLEMVRNA